MEELNSNKTLQVVGAKLPLNVGTKWCRYARGLCKKRENSGTFHDLAEFVKEEADLATDPIFSPESLQRERLKPTENTRVRVQKQRSQAAGTFPSSSSRRSASSGRNRLLRVPQGDSWVGSCPLCTNSHHPNECPELKRRNLEDRIQLVRTKSLCFGCLREGHQSKNCRGGMR